MKKLPLFALLLSLGLFAVGCEEKADTAPAGGGTTTGGGTDTTGGGTTTPPAGEGT